MGLTGRVERESGGSPNREVVYELSLADLELCERVALWRSEEARRRGIPDRRLGRQSGYEIERLGLCAEVAFARHYGLAHEVSMVVRGDGGGWDFVCGVVRVSVKSRFTGRYLTIPPRQWPPRCDVYVLLEPAPILRHVMRFIGWCWASSVAGLVEKRDWGGGWGYILEDRHLWPMTVPIAGMGMRR